MAVMAIAALGAWLAPAGYASMGWAIGSTVGSMLLAKKQKIPDVIGPKLGELSVQNSNYGNAIPIVYGQARVSGNVIWSGPPRQVEHVQHQSVGGGKGGGGGSTVTKRWYSYRGNWAIAFARGPITRMVRIWADDHLIYDADAGRYHSAVRIYRGTEDQLPDPLIESHKGVGRTPAYRGLAYATFDDFNLEPFGNRLPNIWFELEGL
ncbi:hypothetical protein ACQZV8_07370 [Magnetococcales bacterium HHB-1]